MKQTVLPTLTHAFVLALGLLLAPGLRASAEAPTPSPLPTPAAVKPPPASPAWIWPAPLTLRYAIYGQLSIVPYQADGQLRWVHDGKTYDARMEVGMPLLGSRVQTSSGRLAQAGLQPLRFVDRVRSDRTVEFDYEGKRIRFSEGAPPEPLAAGAQDQLGIFMQLGALIATAPQRYPAGSEIVLPAMGIHGPESWRFVVNGEEQLRLPGGDLVALKLSRPPTRGDDPGAEIWLAPSLGWLPARIRLSQPNGDYVDQRWRGSEAP